MRLLGVQMEGFRSFASEQFFDLSKLRPGLYHVHGRNEVYPHLEGNGVGKSTLFEAIYWCLYGTTSRKLRGGNVKNWSGGRHCSVVLNLEVPAGSLVVYREQGPPNKLEVSENSGKERPIDQKELEALVGFTDEAFLFGIYQTQFGARFLDLAPTPQMAAYSSVLDLDLWERASSQASLTARAHETTIYAQREELARLQGQAQSLSELSYEEDETRWNAEQHKKVTTLSRELVALELTKQKQEEAVRQHTAGGQKFREIRETVQEAGNTTARHHREAERLEQEMIRLRSKDLKNCPVCGAPIKSKDHIKDEIERLDAERQKAKKASDAWLAEHDKRTREMVKYRDEEERLLDAEKALSATKAASQTKTAERARVQSETNPFTKKKQEQEETANRLITQIEEAQAKLTKREVEQKKALYWTDGFKQVRLMLIKESLTQLEVEANEALFQLGLRDWSLEFDVERETKKKTIDRNFSVMVRAPNVKEPQPWEAWSGGETQRLRTAGTLGFANLICARRGITPNFELWDEPSQHINAQGIDALLEALSARAQAQQKVILLADHNVLNSGAFAGTIQVVMDKNGSRIST